MKLAEIYPLTEAVIKPWRKRTLLQKTDLFTEDDVKKATDALIKYCPGFLPALKNSGILYRGSSASSRDTLSPRAPKLSYVDSSTGVRTSKDTNNFYQLMMEISEPLNDAGIPHRSKSLICSTSLMSASNYGAASAVIPVGNPVIAVSDYKDFLNTRVKYAGGLLGISLTDTHFLDYLNIQLSKFSDGIYDDGIDNNMLLRSSKKYNTSLTELEQKIAAADVDVILAAWLRAVDPVGASQNNQLANAVKSFIEKNHHTFLHALASELLTVESLALKKAQFGDAIPFAKECWFSGKAFLLPRELFAKVVDEVKVRGYEVSDEVET